MTGTESGRQDSRFLRAIIVGGGATWGGLFLWFLGYLLLVSLGVIEIHRGAPRQPPPPPAFPPGLAWALSGLFFVGGALAGGYLSHRLLRGARQLGRK